jgi:hypothetical protein
MIKLGFLYLNSSSSHYALLYMDHREPSFTPIYQVGNMLFGGDEPPCALHGRHISTLSFPTPENYPCQKYPISPSLDGVLLNYPM